MGHRAGFPVLNPDPPADNTISPCFLPFLPDDISRKSRAAAIALRSRLSAHPNEHVHSVDGRCVHSRAPSAGSTGRRVFAMIAERLAEVCKARNAAKVQTEKLAECTVGSARDQL